MPQMELALSLSLEELDAFQTELIVLPKIYAPLTIVKKLAMEEV